MSAKQSILGPHLLLLLAMLQIVGGCSVSDRLQQVGKTPKLTAIDNPINAAGYRPVSVPMPKNLPQRRNPNSLWRGSSANLLGNTRASSVGDIVTVTLRISDRAQIDNATNRTRTGSDSLGGTGAVANQIDQLLPAGGTPAAKINFNSSSASGGTGSVNRSEQLVSNISALVTQILPNGNLVIEGRQEVRVNFELREIFVAGIVRPEDIAPNNTVESSKIAQARISYGGRGQISDVQQPRLGQQILDILMPF